MPEGEGPRRLHPLTLLFAALNVARRLIFPAVIGAFSASREAPGDFLFWLALILTVPTLLFGAAKYISFRYRLGPDELIITSGILRRHHRVIPFSRVQNIEMRQHLLQQLAGVAELRIETAGGAGEAEADLTVLSRTEAERLRLEVLARRQRSLADRTDQPEMPPTEASRTLATLGTRDLVLAGATANEAGLIAAALFGALQFFDPLLGGVVERVDVARLPGPSAALLFLAGALALFIVLGWIVSILGSVIGYHGFTLERNGGELRKRYGLVNRREGSIPLERVQAIRIEESLLRRPLGLASMKVATAGGPVAERQRAGAEAFLPLARVNDLPSLVAGVFPELDLGALHFLPVHPRSRRRAFVRYAAVLVVTSSVASAIAGLQWAWLLLLLPAAYGIAVWQYRHRAFALAPGFVAARNGVLNRITWIVPDWKLQVLLTTQTPFQRRHDLASVTIDTAGGGRQAAVVDLLHEDAIALQSELVQRLRVALRRGRRRAAAPAPADG
jgi:putative membrane protein